MKLRKLDRFALQVFAIPISFSVVDQKPELLLQEVYLLTRSVLYLPRNDASAQDGPGESFASGGNRPAPRGFPPP